MLEAVGMLGTCVCVACVHLYMCVCVLYVSVACMYLCMVCVLMCVHTSVVSVM